MGHWLAKARIVFPELETLINENQNGPLDPSPLDLWIDLFLELEKAYDTQPPNDDLIARIYDYAAWCFQQADMGDVDSDLSSAAAVGLIESIPLNKRVSDDLFRWMSQETFDGCEQLFRYHLSDLEYENFSSQFHRKKRTHSGPSHL